MSTKKRKVSDIGTAITVAHLGKLGTFSEQAAAQYFKDEKRPVTYQDFKSFAEVFNAVESQECKYGVVPIENSDSGSFRQVYDLLTEHKLFIVGEYASSEEFCLCALPGVKKADVKEVLSHPKAFENCDNYLSKLALENKCEIKRTAMGDTVEGCERLVESKSSSSACIASSKAALLHKLAVLESPISNDKHIMTRYVVLSRDQSGVSAAAVQLKSTVCLAVKNQKGALFKLLSCFAFRDINVLQVEARPSSKALEMFDHSQHWEYIHFIDYEPSGDNKKDTNLLSSLDEYCISVRSFGTYRKHVYNGNDEYTLMYH